MKRNRSGKAPPSPPLFSPPSPRPLTSPLLSSLSAKFTWSAPGTRCIATTQTASPTTSSPKMKCSASSSSVCSSSGRTAKRSARMPAKAHSASTYRTASGGWRLVSRLHRVSMKAGTTPIAITEASISRPGVRSHQAEEGPPPHMKPLPNKISSHPFPNNNITNNNNHNLHPHLVK